MTDHAYRDPDPLLDLVIVPQYRPEIDRTKEIEEAIIRDRLLREIRERRERREPTPIHWIDA